MNVGIYSCVYLSLNKDISYYQKKVFDKFNLNLKRVIIDKKFKKTHGKNSHGASLNKIIHEATEDYIIIFDIDCIPLNKSFYNILLSQIKDGNTLSGSRGVALHIDKTKAYIHPSFFGFKRSLYYDCGEPNLMYDKTGDTAQNFTHYCRKSKKKIKFWNVTHSNDITYEASELNLKFGHGTVYENTIYHQYGIRKLDQHAPFLEKCKEVLNT